MAFSGWWCISLVVLVVFAFEASAQMQMPKPWSPPAAPGRYQTPLQKPWSPPAAPGKDQRPLQPPVMPTPEVPDQGRCSLEEADMVLCGSPDIAQAQCEAINCCFSTRAQKCFYGRKTVTVQCTRDGQFVVVVARDSTVPTLDLDSISLLGDQDLACAPAGNTDIFTIFQFPVTACGTTMVEDDSNVIYENRLVSSYEVGVGPRGSITRDSHFELMFQCQYSSTAVEALVVEVNQVPPPASVAVQGPLRVELRLASGQCFTKGCVEEEEAYSSFYRMEDYPVIKTLRQPVYVEVRILERTDPDLVLTLDRCWATSTSDSLSLPQWDLLVDGCPFWDDRHETTVVPVDASSGLQYPTHHKRFILKMFTFVDRDTMVPMNERVFIHCSAAVCYPTDNDSCVQRCTRPRRGGRAVSAARMSKIVSSGEVILTNTAKWRSKQARLYPVAK